MKFELKLCPNCFCMTNHFVKDNGESVCGKCGKLNKPPKLPPGWDQMFGLKK